MKERPDDATHFIHGLYYKIGVHGFVFYWSGASQEWQKSDRQDLHLREGDEY